MKTLISFVALCMLAMPAMSATGRVGMVKSPVAAAVRANPAKMASMKVTPVNPTATADLTDKSSVRVEETVATIPQPEIDRREKEKAACLQNNIGVGNTFVWASRYSNINDYSTMIEDVENPENNTCFVRVTLKSSDSRFDLSDIPGQYYEMGRNITCGAWADADKIDKRILVAKKNARTWSTVGGAVGGAALGVGSMELFGNELIGGKVQGQKNKNLTENEVYRSQLLVLKKDNSSQYGEAISYLRALKAECDRWQGADADKPQPCKTYDYDYLLGVDTENN